MSDVPGRGVTAGSLLRSARERQGLHIGALAAAIKVTTRKLDALENDRHDELPDATFTRALAQSVCRTLKIEAAPVLALLPPPAGLSLAPRGRVLNAPFRDRPGPAEPALSLAAIRPLVWAASVLVVGTLLVHFWPAGASVDGWFDRLGAGASMTAATGSAAVPPVSAAPAVPTAAVADAAPAATSQPVVEAVSAVPPTAAAADSAASAASALVQVRSSEPSWVEVRDGQNQLLMSRTVQPGENIHLDGALPLRLTIGNAAATQLGFRGQAVDIAARTRDNIARVELQ